MTPEKAPLICLLSAALGSRFKISTKSLSMSLILPTRFPGFAVLISHCNPSSFASVNSYFHRRPHPSSAEIKGFTHMSEISFAFFSCRFGSFHFPQEAYQCLIRSPVTCRGQVLLSAVHKVLNPAAKRPFRRGRESPTCFYPLVFPPLLGEEWKINLAMAKAASSF